MERKNAWNTYDENAMKELEQVTEQYRRFISEGKTERECAQLTVETVSYTHLDVYKRQSCNGSAASDLRYRGYHRFPV